MIREGLSTFFRKHWDALLAIITACIFIYLFTRHSGIGISPDSVSYYSAAKNIRTAFSFTDFNGNALVDFPVGYPAFLAVLSFITHIGILEQAPVINAILFSFVILFTSIIINGYKQVSRWYKILFLAVLACSPALLEVYSMLWSETLFVFLSLLFCLCVRYYFETHSYSRLVLLGFVTALAFVTRYAGISLVLAGGMLIFFDGSLALLKKIAHLFVFGFVGVSLAAANLVHNHYATASFTGVREKALRSFSDNFVQLAGVVSDWLPFLKTFSSTAIIVTIVIFVAAFCVLIFRVLQQQYYHTYETVIVALLITYTTFIIVTASISRFEDLSNRLLSPVYIPLLLLSSSWYSALIKRSTRLRRQVLLLTGLVAFGMMQYHQYNLNAAAWEGIKDAGIPGYSENSWQTSPTIHFIRLHRKELANVIYSDANDAVYFLAGIHSEPLPHKEIQTEIDALLQREKFSVVWLNDGFNADLVDIDFIKKYKRLKNITQLEDGVIYYFEGDIAR